MLSRPTAFQPRRTRASRFRPIGAPTPTGRSQYRYFAGQNWTLSVANQGIQSAEPVGTPLPGHGMAVPSVPSVPYQPVYPAAVYGAMETPEMYAARGLPGIGGVVALTIFFGVFGAILASSNANHAHMVGLSGRRYWKAFWITLGCGVAAGLLIYFIFFMVVLSAVSSCTAYGC